MVKFPLKIFPAIIFSPLSTFSKVKLDIGWWSTVFLSKNATKSKGLDPKGHSRTKFKNFIRAKPSYV
ncbi:unnamed protein product [Blepharisma stoltei]|uniref:Ribosomal protein L32 n=1 Tax=Blepharisma stoltei TaxID=1481888 RepID=A0AAU9I8S6_9CILI|nr:unnamed protein product [Blepharisma stoltei]